MLLPPGSIVGDRYEIVDVVSYGAMGIVYRARHRTLGTELALKAMRAELGSEEFYRRFAEEARNAALLQTEHVARVFDFGRLESGELYLVMELLRGKDLATLLGERGPLSVELVIRIALQACEALGEAHRAGIVHRDLKPENLFLTRSGAGEPMLKVLDFGVSKRLHSAPRKASIAGAMGSPSYMAPEQLRCSRDVDARADVWALGAVLFELLSGRAAFEGESIAEICTNVLYTRPPPLADIRSEVDPALSRIVERCLETDRERRYQSMSELAAALRALDAPDEERVSIPGVRRFRFGRVLGALAMLAAISALGLVGYFGPERSIDLARAGAASYLVGGARVQRLPLHPVERAARQVPPKEPAVLAAPSAPPPAPPVVVRRRVEEPPEEPLFEVIDDERAGLEISH